MAYNFARTGAQIDAIHAKVGGIEASADVTDTANVTDAGALMDSEVDVDIKTLVLPASTTISTAGAALIGDASAADQRTTLGVDALGTDNSTDVTLNASATTGGMSLSTQEISHRAATNAQTGYMTAALVGNIETNNDKVTNATHTGEVTGGIALTVTDNIIDEANLKLETGPTNDHILTADNTKSGGMKWAVQAGGGDVTAAATMTDNTLVKGDGGAKGVQDSGIIITDDDTVSGAGTTFNDQTGTGYTMVIGDSGKTITRTNAGASTHTVPANASVAYKVGTVIGLMNEGAETVTVGITTDTLNQKDSAFDLAAGCQASLTKTGTTTWRLTGELI